MAKGRGSGLEMAATIVLVVLALVLDVAHFTSVLLFCLFF